MIPMSISVPAALKKELKKHPETNWSRVATKAFERQLQTDKILEQLAEQSLSDREILRRGLRVQYPRDIIKKAA
ncbi:MAG: hypothetical protein JRM97_05075 [Nitrososphaerota archaeon]|nr:hypothetical protein [Nitrososphaerota archaeon]MDG6986863.1 hypothetical protein [Nitrososphaerota archaeon]MDG7031981.1 hypothetical protein [Nitrososphaerota archaeon]